MVRNLFGSTTKEIVVEDPLAKAANASMAVIWFEPDGTILDANANFCDLMGYAREEIRGKKHAMFLCEQDAAGSEYKAFWESLRAGETSSTTFRRCTKAGDIVWIEASYVPITSKTGEVEKVVKLALDVTERKDAEAAANSRLDALDRSQARIEFAPDGTILDANENFLATVGYRIEEIRGKHHKLFMDPIEASTPAYTAFWNDLAHGKAQRGKYRRFGKGNQKVWLRATYDPVLDSHAEVVRVVKYAQDITEQSMENLERKGQLEALGRSQAVIEFNPDGTIIKANENFLATLGYELEEIVGKHHSLFVSKSEADSPEYRAFWAELATGAFKSDEFRRKAKDGSDVWIQATYNPIMDEDGEVYKVVKFATNTTKTKQALLTFQEAMTRLSTGDLAVRISTPVPDQFESLKGAFNTSLTELSQVIGGISVRADTILNEVAQIAGATLDLSQRTEHQASTLEETATALDEMAASIRNAADGTSEAAKTSEQAQDSTTNGMDTVKQAIAAMEEISESSSQVSRITDVIDDIAFQTNLLALNAGVEAARAGESGRGFAVVASEVRQLAQRSSDAAGEIASLIRNTSNKIDAGVTLVTDSGGALERIAGFVSQIREQLATLSSAAREQSIGLDEITSAMNQLDQVTQQNAAMFEETSAANQTLEAEANALTASTRSFSISQESHDAAMWAQDSEQVA
ncbi:MAG: methyl-accepting chemotaxis protein [Maritimibacter sp.]